MTTTWATLLIYEAMKNGQISEDAAKYFDELIEVYSSKTYSNSIFDGYIHRDASNTVTYTSIEGVFNNILRSFADDGLYVKVYTWSRYIDMITYNKNGEKVSLEEVLGIRHDDYHFNQSFYDDIKEAFDENCTDIEKVRRYIKYVEQVLDYFKNTDRKNVLEKLTALLRQGEEKLAEMEKDAGVNTDNQ